jgi:hypothetical protein
VKNRDNTHPVLAIKKRKVVITPDQQLALSATLTATETDRARDSGLLCPSFWFLVYFLFGGKSCFPRATFSLAHLSVVAGSVHATNLVAFLAQETKLKTVPYASLHRRLTFSPFAMAPCATDRKRVHFMEPVSRLSCRLFYTLPTFI